MLYFDDKELEPLLSTQRCRCSRCKERVATWMVPLAEHEKKGPLCAWCVMYSKESEWGYRHREELLHVGRACVGMAAQHRKTIPVLDELGRLSPDDAEKYMLGVAFTSRMLRGPLGVIADAG